MKKKQGCGCDKCSKTRKEVLETRESFKNKVDALGIFEAFTFQKNKPFKVTFNEDVEVTWTKQHLEEAEKPKKLTKRDVKQKEEMVMKLKGKMGNFKKKYGKRAKGVMYAVATKHAKKTP